jgi:AraC-like DNA-binding protein
MTGSWSARTTEQDSLFSRYLLPLKESIPGSLLEEAALPPLHKLSDATTSNASSAFHRVCQSVHLIALSGPALNTPLSSRRGLSLMYLERGELELLHDHQRCLCLAGTWVLVPGCSLTWKSSAFRVICLLIPPEQIAWSPDSCRPDALAETDSNLPEGPRVVHSSSTRVGRVVLELLTALLRAASQLHGDDPDLLERLAIGDQVCSLVAALIDPKPYSLSSSESSQQVVSQEDDHFDALIRYVNSNLHQPLNLTVLAKQSHYSTRALQYVFRNRLGCTATQWIRNQRLDLAWQLLHSATPEDNVTRIAQACGYRSMSLFSIEFQRRFHIKPSVLLRSTRDSQGIHGAKQDDSDALF